MAKRRRAKVLGFPIGKKQPSPLQPLWVAGAGAALAAAVPLARQAGHLVGRTREMAAPAARAIDRAREMQDAVASHATTIGKVGAAVGELSKLGKSSNGQGPAKLSHLIEEHTDIAVARTVAYNQWTQLEMFPSIVKGVEEVEQEEDDQAEWTGKIGPSRRHWQARIVEQVPDERIVWKSEGGAQVQGVVTFHSLDKELTRVLVQMEYHPEGPIETIGNLLRIQRRRVRRDLRLFKHYLELRHEETGAWRGRIGADERPPATASGRRPRGAATSSSDNDARPARSSGSSGSSGSSKSSGSSGSSGSSRSSGSSAPASKRAVSASKRPSASTGKRPSKRASAPSKTASSGPRARTPGRTSRSSSRTARS
jgi:uncharacterized membrane protein